MTIRTMARPLLIVILIGALVSSCAGPTRPETDGSEAAQAEVLEDLATRVADLESELAAAETDRDRAGERLDELGDRLDKALERLRGSLADIRSSAATAGDEAASAIATAQSVAADLDVLEERFEYHLRRYHGGG